jgi:hypothetical protein
MTEILLMLKLCKTYKINPSNQSWDPLWVIYGQKLGHSVKFLEKIDIKSFHILMILRTVFKFDCGRSFFQTFDVHVQWFSCV